MKTYALRMTRLASAMAAAKYSVDSVKQRAREEVDGLGLEDPTCLFHHCFRMPGSDRYEFICLPDEGGLVIDTLTFEEYGEPLTTGPLAGKRLKMAVPDTEN